jgi:hypothetical protein
VGSRSERFERVCHGPGDRHDQPGPALASSPSARCARNQDGVVAPTEVWYSVDDPNLGNVVMHFTFATPVGSAPANQQADFVSTDR